jgi:L-fuconolactonase
VLQSEPDDRFMLRPAFRRGIARLDSFGLAYDLLILPRHLSTAVELATAFPRQRFVLDHLAKPFIRAGEIEPWARDLRRLAERPNVLCKLSGLVTEADWRHWTPAQLWPYLDVALECFGPHRLMIGSDWPVCTVAADYATTMTAVRDWTARLSRDERAAVLGGNAARFWNLRVS